MKCEKDCIKKKIEGADIVSFDVFDTLLLRNVYNPTDIFQIVQNIYSKKYNEKIKFKEKRIEAERKARNKSKNEDICFDEIYNYLLPNDGTKQQILKKLEIQVEEKFIIANELMLEIFNYAKEKEKQILIISDMYLSSQTISKFLTENGYKDFEKVYVSSEIKKSKGTGNIYKYIRNDLNIDMDKKWVHIGDNYISDVKNARKNSIDGIYYKKLSERQEINNVHNLTDSIICAIKINMETMKEYSHDYWTTFGMRYASPIYIGIMYYLIKNLKNKDNIYFLSRDGWLPYKMYNIIRKYYKNLPHAKYIYASRRAYVYPSLCDNQEEAVKLFLTSNSSFNEKLTIENILENLNLNVQDYMGILQNNNFVNKNVNDNIELAESILKEIWNDIKANLDKEKDILIEYLKQEGMFDYNIVNIFDIGWAGSTHKAIENLICKNVEGYYFGTAETIDKQVKSESHGYLFENGFPINIRNKIIQNAMIYEMLFTAPEGSLKRFIYNETGNIAPELIDFQYNDINKYITTFQDGAINVLKKALEYRDYIEEEPSKEFVLNCLNVFIKKKNIDDLIQFENLRNSVSVGQVDNMKPYVKHLNINEYLQKPKYYVTNSYFNLWRGALIIEDNFGRLFNLNEFNKLYNISIKTTYVFYLGKILYYIKKGILHPKKALNRILNLMESKLKQK